MDIFQSIADALRATSREDPRFGTILFIKTSGKEEPSYWDGSGTFAGEEVNFLVDADENGPTQAQRDLADALEKGWSAMTLKLARVFESQRADVLDEDHARSLDGWVLSSIALPAAGPGARKIEVAFMERDGGELLTFEFHGIEPRAMRIGS